MDRPRVLVAHEWASARVSIAAYLAHLRPTYAVQAVLPADLDAALATDPASVVVCGELTEAIERRAPGWIVLPVEGLQEVTVGAGTKRRTLPNPEFGEVVAAIDVLLAGPDPGVSPTAAEGDSLVP